METIDIQIKSNAPEVTKETTSLRQQMKDLRKEMESCTVGSEEYAAALQKLANVTHDFKDQQEEIRNSAGDLGTVFGNLQSVSSGVVSGFSAINAITTIFGANSEDLQKVMVKLQAGMALVQGMKGLEGMGKSFKALVTSVKSMITTTKAQSAANKALAASEGTVTTATKATSAAMKGLKAALISTGIGILVVAVGELIANFDKLTKWFGNITNDTNEYENANENLNTSFEKQNKELDREITLMQASGASTQDIINKKKKLKEEQLAETLATIKNIEARNAQLEADKRWWKFWTNSKNNKEIAANNEELKKLNETVETLQESIVDLNTEAQADVIKTSRETSKKVAEDAKKAAEDAKKVAEEISKAAKKVGDDVKKQLDELVKQYSKTIKSIQTITGALNATNVIEGAVSSDIDAWITVYGTDPKSMERSLTGTLNALVNYAYEEAVRIRDEALSKAKNDLEKDEIGKAFTDSITNIYKTAYPEIENTGFELGDILVTGTNEAISKSKSISQTFTEQFNALNHLYEEGIIDYEQFYDTLVNIQNDYNTAVKDFDEKYIDETKQSEEYIAQLKYNYALKPLAFQQEVGDKFLAELDKQNMLIEANSARCWDVYNISLKAQLEKAAETWNIYSAGTLKQRYESEQNQLDFQKAVYDQEYNAKVEHINNLLDLDTLTVEQEAELRDQLEQLNRDKLNNDIEYYAESTSIRDEYYASLHEAVSQGVEAFNDLTNNLANVFTAAAETMKDSEGNYTKEGKKMLETSAALQIATATMNAASGIATVWATSAQLGPIAGPIVAGIQTASHIANLAVQIMSIKKALSQGLAGNTSGSATSTSTPDTTFTLTSPDAYQNTLSDEVQTDLQANAKDNQRVYVLESDITSKQDNVKSAVTTSTF